MHDPERHALIRAVLVLLAVSLVRWAMDARAEPPVLPGAEAGALAEHAAATEEAAAEEERRSRPLQEGERLDPNRADPAELDRLPGVGPSTAAAVVAARQAGTVFRIADDLLAVRGIGPATLERIRPWIALPAGRASRRATPRDGGRRGRGAGSGRPGRAAASASGAMGAPGGVRGPGGVGSGPVDLNRADVGALQELPGIGPSLAQRIVEERRARPFASVADLERVRGIGPATVARLRGLAVVTGGR